MTYDGFIYLIPFFELALLVFTFMSVLIGISSVIHYSSIYGKEIHKMKKKGKRVEKEEMIVLANRRSRGYRDGYRRRLLKIFAKRRRSSVVYLPNKKEMFKNIEKKLSKAKQVIIAGGDGSFEGALNYKPLQNKVLGFFPLGAGNAFYSYFYKGKRFEYLRSRFPFNVMKLDILELEWDKGKTQTIFVNVGIDAEVIRLSKKRSQHGFLDYVVGSWKALLKSKADYDLKINIDGKNVSWENCVSLMLAKIPYLGFGLRGLMGKVKPNDGKVYSTAIINTHSAFFNKPLRIWALFMGMFNLNKSPYSSISGKKIFIQSEVPFPIQAGGEFIGYSNWLKIKVKRKQKVLVIN